MQQLSSQQKNELTKHNILVRGFLVLFFLFVWLILFRFGNRNDVVYGIFIWFFPYIVFLIFLSLFTKYKLVRFILAALWLPGIILMAAGPLLQIIGSLIYTYILILGGTAILVFIVPKKACNFNIEFSAGIYLVLTISAIAATTFSERLIEKWHNIQNSDYSEFSQKMSLRLFGQKNMRFIIFLFYFILLIVFTFLTLNKKPILKQENIDIAILQSFATFVAFDRLVSTWHNFKK